MKNVHSHERFERNASFISRNVDLLMMKESNVTRSRERSQEAENRRSLAFETFTARESSQFERVEMKILNNEDISASMKRVIRRIDSVSKRDRDRRAREARDVADETRERNERNNQNDDRDNRDNRNDRIDRSRDRERTTKNEKSAETTQIDVMKDVLSAE
jgi:hypothetical protein